MNHINAELSLFNYKGENHMFKDMVGKAIKIDRGGPESRNGKLLDMYDDYLVLLTDEDGVVYYNTHHIKSMTVNTKEQFELKVEAPENFEYKKAPNFYCLLDNLKYQWVKINRGGPEKIEGVLCGLDKDFVSIINNEEVVRISLFHFRNISNGVKPETANEENLESKSQDSEEKTAQSEVKQKQASRKRSGKSKNNQPS